MPQLTDRTGRTRSLTDLGDGPWLVVSPHDDDAALGMGATIGAARAAGIAVHVAVVTDGAMGWNDPADRADLVATRRAETARSLADLGVAEEQTHWMGFPDGSLLREAGCRDDAAGSGVGRALTRLLRELRPAAVFTCTGADIHPDHQVTASEVSIATCWAASPIWAEFGPPIAAPQLWHFAVYCAFPQPPSVQIQIADAFEAKLRALTRYESQPFIDDMVERLRADGPVEYLQQVTWQPYRPASYAGLFAPHAAEEDGQALFAADCAQVPELLRAWRPWPALRRALAAGAAVVGEGSSRLLPANFARRVAAELGVPGPSAVSGGRAAEARSDVQRIWLSNSGSTRELVECAQRGVGEHDLAILGREDGRLAELVAEHRAVLVAPEHAVAATASVFMQAFELAAALLDEESALDAAGGLATAVEALLARTPDPALTARMAACEQLWWSDDESGLAEELALKTTELLGRRGHAVPGTLALHGLEEVFTDRDLVLVFAADPRDDDLRARISESTGAGFLHLDDADCGIVGEQRWRPLLRLVVGWRLLAATAEHLGRDPARPRRARKIGNPVV